MARTQEPTRSNATQGDEDQGRRSSVGRLNKNLFMDGPLAAGLCRGAVGTLAKPRSLPLPEPP
jgi:hypothetical protein